MPYGTPSKKIDKKVEDCVNSVMKSGKDKVAAIKICKSSIMKEEKMDKSTFTYKPEGEMECMGNKITNVHIFKPGEYRGNKWTKEIVKKMVENFKTLKEKAGFEPPVRIGHRGDNSVENAKATIGYIEDLRSDEDGNLFADMDIADDSGYEDIRSKKLKNRSVEIGPYETNEGDEFDNVIWGVGWVDIPQVEGLTEVSVYSKPLMEEEMEKKQYDKIVKQAEELLAKKNDSSEVIKKCITSLKELLTSKIKDESFFDVARISEFINSLKYQIEEGVGMKKEELAKIGDVCKMPDGTDGKMMMEDGKMVCGGGKGKMDKEEDLAEETSKEIDEKVDLDKEEADEDEESDDESEGKEDMDKKQMVSMSKSEVADLKAAKEELGKIKFEETKSKLAKRTEKIDAFHKEARIVPAMLDKEKEFAQSLSDEQFEKYVEIKSVTPSMVKLDKDSGSQTSKEPKTDEEKSKEQVAQKAGDLVKDSLLRKNYSKEEVEKMLEEKK
jgi:hypothetical protein